MNLTVTSQVRIFGVLISSFEPFVESRGMTWEYVFPIRVSRLAIFLQTSKTDSEIINPGSSIRPPRDNVSRRRGSFPYLFDHYSPRPSEIILPFSITGTSTAEPTASGIIWTYIKEMEQYNALWEKEQKIIFDLGNIVNDICESSCSAHHPPLWYIS